MTMRNCYLCQAEAEISGQDFGRRKIVRCPKCVYYEASNVVISNLEDKIMPDGLRASLIKSVKCLNENRKDAEVFFDGINLGVREKKNL
jgi:hypothetical protein